VAEAKRNTKSTSENGVDLIDPLYQKFTKSVVRALGSSDFYAYFMQAIAQADNEIQFSNRRMEKIVDLEWVDAIESSLPAFQHIIDLPRNVIREDELIVNVANAKKSDSAVVRHLAMHASMVEDFREDTGDVRPNKLMQKYREESIGKVYENRLVFTTLEIAYQFVKIRHDALFEAMSDEFGAKLKLRSDMVGSNEQMHLDMFLHIRDTESALQTDERNQDVFDRISRLYRILAVNMNSNFAQQLAKEPRIKGTVTKTNVLKKNKDYRAVSQLLEFLRGYNNIGYTIKIIEQNPVVDEAFEQSIYHNILFQYLVLKGHLERDKDRRLPAPLKQKKRALKPKFVKEIIEELTEDYDLPDVEIRKVLIEELTKEQLMREEAAERRRLVEEQAQRKKEEEARIRKEKQEEKERLRKEREAEKERQRKEAEAEAQRKLVERMEREQEDRRRSGLFKKELEHFTAHFAERLELRHETAEEEQVARQDFEDAAFILEETERLKREEAERARIRRREEQERRIQAELEAQQQALAAENERREKLRQEKLAEEARPRREIEEQEELARQEKARRDMEAVRLYAEEIGRFWQMREYRQYLRNDYANAQIRMQQAREEERQKLLDARNVSQKRNRRFWRR